MLETIPGLPGYLLVENTMSLGIVDPLEPDRLNGMFLRIPTLYGRDLNDADLEIRGGGEWIRFGSYTYSPLAAVPVLGPGNASATIGGEGFAEWRKLPPSGAVSVVGCSAWKLYDSDFLPFASGTGSGGSALPGTGGAAYLMLFGPPEASIDLKID
jgi:hypothetical protein